MKKIESFCPVRDILSKFGDKWSVLVLLILEENEKIRFSELARQIPDISQKMLTTTLRNLEAMNLIKRHVFPQVPPRVEYNLTKLGISLMPSIHSLVDWALLHSQECM